MISLSDIEKMPLATLYLLIADKIEEMKILGVKETSDPEFKVRRLEIETIQKVIDSKKVKQINK
jgi:hypothetical protein